MECQTNWYMRYEQQTVFILFVTGLCCLIWKYWKKKKTLRTIKIERGRKANPIWQSVEFSEVSQIGQQRTFPNFSTYY